MPVAHAYRKPDDLPDTIPVFPLDGALVLPRAPLPLNIFEPRYLNMVDDALMGARLIGMVQTAPGGQEDAPALADVGCVGRITSFTETPDSRYLITLSGVCRFRVVEELRAKTPYRQVRADFARYDHDLRVKPDNAEIDRAELIKVLRVYLEANELKADWSSIESAPVETLVNSLAMICPFDPPEKQALLEAETLRDRSQALAALMRMSALSGTDGSSSSMQ